MSDMLPVEHYEEVNKVVELYIKGHNYSQIATATGVPRKKVMEHISDWKSVVSRDPYIKARALDTVNEAMESYDAIKRDAWGVAERAKADDDRKVELQALGLAASIEKQRFEHLKAAGILQDEDITSQIIEVEEQKQRVIEMLRTIAPKLCDKDRRMVAEELSKLSGRTEVMKV